MKKLKFFFSLLVLIPLITYGNIIHVNQNGSGNFTSIQSAILYASTGDTVLVYPGNYIEIVDFIGNDIVVASLFLTTQDTSYISQTIIDGNHENNRLVRFTNGETEDAKLIGFTITRATDPAEPGGIYIIQGLGIYINGSSPIIANNRIINNSYEGWYYSGGGIAMVNSSAKITNNTISNNEMVFHGGGIYLTNCTNVNIENNQIQDNFLNPGYGVSFGAGIYIDSSQYISINKNVFERNDQYQEGGAMYIRNCNHILINNNIISDNGRENGGSGGGIKTWWSENINIVGNLITDNKAGAGAGLYFEDSQILLVNNTICFNTSSGIGGGIYCKNSNPIIHNNILFSNTASGSGNQVYLDIDSNPNIYYSNIEGGTAEFGLDENHIYIGTYENNIDSDPSFILSGPHPYQLEINSPCTNAGNPDTTGLFIPEMDLAGNGRIAQDRIDMGAYEYPFPSNTNELTEANNILVYPNPARDKVTIQAPQNNSKKLQLIINDLKGNMVFTNDLENDENIIDLSFLPRGVYIMNFISDEFVKTEKIVLY